MTNLVVGKTGRDGTFGSVRLQGGVAFCVHVEGDAIGVCIAKRLTLWYIIAGEGGQTLVHASTQRCLLVDENFRVTIGSGGSCAHSLS